MNWTEHMNLDLLSAVGTGKHASEYRPSIYPSSNTQPQHLYSVVVETCQPID